MLIQPNTPTFSASNLDWGSWGDWARETVSDIWDVVKGRVQTAPTAPGVPTAGTTSGVPTDSLKQSDTTMLLVIGAALLFVLFKR